MPEISRQTSKSTDTIDAAARLRLVVARLHRILRQQAMGGLRLTELSCLALVGRLGPMPLGEIATRENLSAPTITKTIARLEAKGYISRLADPSDRRVSLISLSAKGMALIEEVRSRRTAYLNQRLQQLDNSQLAALVNALPILEALTTEDDEERR